MGEAFLIFLNKTKATKRKITNKPIVTITIIVIVIDELLELLIFVVVKVVVRDKIGEKVVRDEMPL